MSLDFQQVRQQITELGEQAPEFQKTLQARHALALEQLNAWAERPDELRQHVEAAIQLNPNLRTAVPLAQSLTSSYPCPPLPDDLTVLAADGSQINPDRHAMVDYCLVNVGAIQMTLGAGEKPQTKVQSRLLYNEALFTRTGRLTERIVALMRDLRERELLAEISEGIQGNAVTLTDGPLELWGAREGDPNLELFERYFADYLEALRKLHLQGVSTAGYIDKPGSDLFVRLLEIASLANRDLGRAGSDYRPLRGITDSQIFGEFVGLHERSSAFKIHSANAVKYPDELALHFFYLHVASTPDGNAYLARVEIPEWVARSESMLAGLHAVLIQQCQILGSRPFPYLLHRSHEVAVVSRDEKEQVEQMIVLELRRRGITPGAASFKQAIKTL